MISTVEEEFILTEVIEEFETMTEHDLKRGELFCCAADMIDPTTRKMFTRINEEEEVEVTFVIEVLLISIRWKFVTFPLITAKRETEDLPKVIMFLMTLFFICILEVAVEEFGALIEAA
jgi:hypothetical protein